MLSFLAQTPHAIIKVSITVWLGIRNIIKANAEETLSLLCYKHLFILGKETPFHTPGLPFLSFPPASTRIFQSELFHTSLWSLQVLQVLGECGNEHLGVQSCWALCGNYYLKIAGEISMIESRLEKLMQIWLVPSYWGSLGHWSTERRRLERKRSCYLALGEDREA